MSIAPDDLKKAFERALKNDLWVAPFSTVGAYMKAHFTMDAATATKSEDSYKVTWTLPHQHMPASIPLKVKLNDDFLEEAGLDDVQKVVIEQNGKSIKPNTDGVFEIEFTALELTIRKADAVSPEKQITEPTSISKTSKTRTPDSNPTHKSIFDAKGRTIPSSNRGAPTNPRVGKFSRP